MIVQFVAGCIFFAFLVVTGHFLKFWKTTGDTFFLLFAVGFTLYAIEWFCLALYIGPETLSYIYILRLIATCFIIVAIVQKNRQ